MNIPITDRWFACFKPRPAAKIRLFCLPYAGGSPLVFRNWAQRLPPSIEVCPVQLPGRGNRLKERPFTNMSDLVPAVAAALTNYLDKPFALFGHSLGAVTCFELTRRFAATHLPGPLHLLVAGCNAPQMRSEVPSMYNRPDSEFIEYLRELRGTPPEVLQHTDMLRLMLPMLRSDFEVSETYEYSVQPPVNCPITALGGTEDVEVTEAGLQAWREHTVESFAVDLLPGDHFFLHASEAKLVDILSRVLDSAAHSLEKSKRADGGGSSSALRSR
jgi:medium-chain acyl-[acyl-carrier-protein] hydrolase